MASFVLYEGIQYMRRLIGLCAGFLMLCLAHAHAGEKAGVAVTIDVRHVSADLWRVDYRFARPVTALKFDVVGEYRQRAWKILTPGLGLRTDAESNIIESAKRRAFTEASVEIKTYTPFAPKDYTSFNRFSDGGRAIYLGHLQGDVEQGKNMVPMFASFRFTGMNKENVITPPANRLAPDGSRGYAYFGPAQAVAAGAAKIVMDPQTPQWLRETILETGAKTSTYYEKAYQRQLKDELLIMVSVDNFESPGFSMKGGAIMGQGQVAYRVEGKLLLTDHPKLREYAAHNVAHEMAHVWQMAVTRGGMGENEGPWIHEGGAEAMALDALLQTGVWNEESVGAYRAKQAAKCEALGGAVDTYDGIYACGLLRFDKLGVGIVPLWRSMMAATETNGDVYSQQMIDTIVSAK
jgi:hypothetical protein